MNGGEWTREENKKKGEGEREKKKIDEYLPSKVPCAELYPRIFGEY